MMGSEAADYILSLASSANPRENNGATLSGVLSNVSSLPCAYSGISLRKSMPMAIMASLE